MPVGRLKLRPQARCADSESFQGLYCQNERKNRKSRDYCIDKGNKVYAVYSTYLYINQINFQDLNGLRLISP